MKRFSWIITLPIAAVAIAFAVSNKGPVTVSFWPLPYEQQAPLYAVAFAGVLIGFIAGAMAAWISGGKWRRRARSGSREVASLKHSLAQKAAAQTGASSGGVPAASQGGAIR
ncbi:MAG: LapA family protein [Alphaproteobacteria bacterium]|nr:LapA family protein [Alphaproteobacteria bacterium]